MHTQWSDGSASVAEMAAAAGDRGYDFLAITDHSRTLRIAGGMDEQTLAAQSAEIEQARELTGARGPAILRSIELNLGREGRGDMDPGALNRLDVCSAPSTAPCGRRRTRRRATSRRCGTPTSTS